MSSNQSESFAPILITAGGRIVCARCTARSKRTGHQCRRPASKSSRAKKCRLHGGVSTGPVTSEGRVRSALAATKHGQYSKATIAESSKKSAEISGWEDIARILGMLEGPRLRGRKSTAYSPITSLDEAWDFVSKITNRAGRKPT